jgi:aromatic ring hydroxylase
MVKTGSDHRKSLVDGRSVYINSEKVDNVTTYRAFGRIGLQSVRLSGGKS